ncbi:uncharacterized protein [Macrobrachium rosenbergii]|uniref:uncharacterized protein n=1 Tax=Macrobrachium rosenbergii TaxID=79674 RepID=UPI0034D6C6BD
MDTGMGTSEANIVSATLSDSTICEIEDSSNLNILAFVDLKGAFDWTNSNVILEELVNRGIKGPLLRLTKNYLTGGSAKAWYQGCESEEKLMEIGTPQGGVLSSVPLYLIS